MLSGLQLRSQRERIEQLISKAGSDPAAAELGILAQDLLAAIEQKATNEMRLRATVTELVAACRASVAADRLGHPHPCVHIEHQLDANGWAPSPGDRPAALLAATASPSPLLTSTAA